MEIDRVQRRVFEALKFRCEREIKVRDDEIERLKEKLELFRNRYVTDMPKVDKLYLHKLRQQLFQRQAELKMKKMNMAIEHEKKIQEMETDHRAEIARLQEARDRRADRDASSQTSETENAVSEFLSSVSKIIKHVPNAKQPEYDPVLAAAKDLRAAQYAERADKNLDRVAVLKNLLDKIKSQPLESTIDSESEVAPDDVSSVCTVDDSIQEMTREFVRDFDHLKEEHSTEMKELKRRMRIARRHVKQRSRELKEAKRQGSITEKEISSNIREQRRIIAAKQRKFDRENETLQLLMDTTEPDKEAYVQELRAENARLKKEVARLDFAVYGRNGKYRKWRISGANTGIVC